MLHLLIGEGEMPKRELTATLTDLWDTAQAADDEFWFVVQGKVAPTPTDQAVMDWMNKNELYYEVLTDDEDSLAEIYAGRQKTHTAKKLSTKAVNLLKANTEDGTADGTADVLTLWVNLQEDDPADKTTLDILQAVIDAGYPAFGLNDSMTAIDLASDEAEEEEEPPKTTPPRPAKKAAATKKAAKRPAPAKYTAEELDGMTLPEVKAIGQSLGITARGKDSWISKILAAQDPQAPAARPVEEEPPAEEVADAAHEVEYEDVPEVGSPEAALGSVTHNGAMVILVDPRTGVIVIKPLTEEMADVLLVESQI